MIHFVCIWTEVSSVCFKMSSSEKSPILLLSHFILSLFTFFCYTTNINSINTWWDALKPQSWQHHYFWPLWFAVCNYMYHSDLHPPFLLNDSDTTTTVETPCAIPFCKNMSMSHWAKSNLYHQHSKGEAIYTKALPYSTRLSRPLHSISLWVWKLRHFCTYTSLKPTMDVQVHRKTSPFWYWHIGISSICYIMQEKQLIQAVVLLLLFLCYGQIPVSCVTVYLEVGLYPWLMYQA